MLDTSCAGSFMMKTIEFKWDLLERIKCNSEDVVVLSPTVEWGVGMERQDPSYGVVVHTSVLRVQALLGGSNSPTSRSPEAVDWFLCI